jgi:hypothetical protein
MTNSIARSATSEPTVCAVCRRHALWIGYAPKQRREIIWLCDDNECHAAAKGVYRMPSDWLDEFEIGAVLEAGGAAGTYLEKIGKTDLATLSPDEWRTFLQCIVVGYERALRRKILNNEAPF